MTLNLLNMLNADALTGSEYAYLIQASADRKSTLSVIRDYMNKSGNYTAPPGSNTIISGGSASDVLLIKNGPAGGILAVIGGNDNNINIRVPLTLFGGTYSGSNPSSCVPIWQNVVWDGSVSGNNVAALSAFFQVSENILSPIVGIKSVGVNLTTTAGATGDRTAGSFVHNLIGLTAGTAQVSSLGLEGKSNIMVSQGGTSFTNARGIAFGFDSVAHSGPNATFLEGVVGAELSTWTETGSSMKYKIGAQIVDIAPSGASGNIDNVGLSLNNQYNQGDGPGWSLGIGFGRGGGYFPMAITGTMIGAKQNIMGGGMTVARGIDWTPVTFTQDILKFPGFSLKSAAVIVTDALVNAANDTAAATAGVAINQWYRNGSALMQRIT